MREPLRKRVAIFVDGQNLFYAAKEAFGYDYPNYDIKKLVTRVCDRDDWEIIAVNFYTGIPNSRKDPRSYFWSRKLSSISNKGVKVFSRPLRWGKEKGIDVKIALDVVRGAIESQYDVVVIFSQDQDFSEVAKEIRYIAKKSDKWIKIASAFPANDTYRNEYGIGDTDWIRISKETYDQCIDPKDYRSPQSHDQ